MPEFPVFRDIYEFSITPTTLATSEDFENQISSNKRTVVPKTSLSNHPDQFVKDFMFQRNVVYRVWETSQKTEHLKRLSWKHPITGHILDFDVG